MMLRVCVCLLDLLVRSLCDCLVSRLTRPFSAYRGHQLPHKIAMKLSLKEDPQGDIYENELMRVTWRKSEKQREVMMRV